MLPRTAEPIITLAILFSQIGLGTDILAKSAFTVVYYTQVARPRHTLLHFVEAAAASESCKAVTSSFVIPLVTFPVLQQPNILRRHRGKD